MIGVGKGKALDFLKFPAPDFSAEALACSSRKMGASHTESHGSQSAQNHLGTFEKNVMTVL